jgi:hypothetical protein
MGCRVYSMKISQVEWAKIRQQFIDETARRGVSLTLRERVWAVTPTGRWVALPGTSDSPIADRWWLGCDPEKLRARRPLGVILLCQEAGGGSMNAIGLPEGLFRDVEPGLSKNGRQVFFNVVRRGTRFLLQLRGGEEIDVTERLNDVSWVTDDEQASISSEGIRRSGRAEPVEKDTPPEDASDDEVGQRDAGGVAAVRFFAVVKNGMLDPLDDVALEPGSLYLVEVRGAQAVPGNRFLRRIVARGGPEDLPPDFSERHDYYAHGAVRR